MELVKRLNLALLLVFTWFHYMNPILGDENSVHGQTSGDTGVSTEEGTYMYKRSVEASNDHLWTKRFVPYTFQTKKMPAIRKSDAEAVMQTYERFTCLRFIPWESNELTNDRLGLDHHNHLHFLADHDKCYSDIGNNKQLEVQNISCCDQERCVRYLGHALGLIDEAASPSPERNYLVRFNLQNMSPDEVKKSTPRPSEDVYTPGYDLSSYTHPHFTKNMYGTGPSYTLLYPEYNVGHGYFNMMREVSNAHRCFDLCSRYTKCENDGYYTMVDGKCACRCVNGLNPASGCTTISTSDYFFSRYHELEFPGGAYAMPAPASGCPDDVFTLENNKCVSRAAESTIQWPGGNYCLYKIGQRCPEGFKSGEIILARDYEKIEYCCRRNGFSEEEIFLPSRKPITLIKYPGPTRDCQAIRGMHYTDEKVKVEGVQRKTGSTPLGHASYLHYCHYIPAKIDCGHVYELTDSNINVTFESPKEEELQCVWLIKAPVGEKIVVDFTSHDVDCNGYDELEIRYDRIGYPGQRKCGKQLDENYISFNNSFYIRFSTFGDSKSSFSVTAKLIQNRDLCYNPEDHGQSYAGSVNFTRNFEECLPWSEVTHCPYHSYNYKTFNTILEGNYCRNPDQATGIMPWCYIKSRYCERNYCDVCLHRKRVDKKSNCGELKKNGKCPLEGCALTCEDQYPVDPPVNASSVKCNPPCPVFDGTLVSKRPRRSYLLSASTTNQGVSQFTIRELPNDGTFNYMYNVGDRVTYKCNYGTKEYRVCLTSGKWSSLGTACRNSRHYYDSCVDYWNACPDLFKKNPAMCWYYPNFAKTNCLFTCGFCNYDKTPHCQAKNTTGLNYSAVGAVPDVIRRGNLVNYTCNAGLVALTQNTMSGCQASGEMTKLELTCVKDCEQGWTYNVETRSCYKYFNELVSYNQAISKCSELGGWLVMPKTKTQTDFLITHLYKEGQTAFWIGVSDKEKEGTYLWADGEEVGRCSDWLDHQPDNFEGIEDCVQVTNTGLWNDYRCYDVGKYACQVPHDGSQRNR